MKKILALLILGFTIYGVSAQIGPKTISLFDDKFIMLIPTDVDTMSAAKVQSHYPKVPDGYAYYYSNTDGDFLIVVGTVTTGVTEEDMVKHKDDLLVALKEEGYKLEENKIKKVNNHNLIVVSFYSDELVGKVFNRRFFAVVRGRLILVKFTFYGNKQEKRIPQIEQSINSVIIK